MTNHIKKHATGRAVKLTPMPDLSKAFSSIQLAQTITAKRTGLKLSLVDVSQALSLSKPTLIKIEKGDSNVKFANILKVMEFIGVSFTIISDEPEQGNHIVGERDEQWY